VLVKWFRSCNWFLMYCMWTFTNKQRYFSRQVQWNLRQNMLQFVHVIGFYLYSITLHSLWHDVCFNYSNILRCNQVALSRQRWLLSSCAQQTPWCKLQGTVDGHIQLPKRQYQQVCQRQPMVRQNHPTIKRTCSKIHNYTSPLSHHK